MTLAQIFNQMWTEESYPDDFAYAEVVSIYKKGNPELPENYRPMSLLNSSYKILTKILQTRIADTTDQLISDTQFGSRRGKKYLRTAVLRETPTGYSRSWPPKHNCDLDWEKAFDRISHMRLVELPERMKTDSKMFSNIKALYEHPCFKTVHKNRESEWKKNILEFVKDAPCPPIFLF